MENRSSETLNCEKAKSYFVLEVRNIPGGTSKEKIEEFFSAIAPVSGVIIEPCANSDSCLRFFLYFHIKVSVIYLLTMILLPILLLIPVIAKFLLKMYVVLSLHHS